MVTDFDTLVALCDQELKSREYMNHYYKKITFQWDELGEWLHKQNLNIFNEEIGNRYLEEVYGSHLLPSKSSKTTKIKYRAIRMLITYQQYGDFEYRIPKVEYIFDGPVGNHAEEYLEYCRSCLKNSQATLGNKRFYLYDFATYLDKSSITIDDLSLEIIEDFFNSKEYTLASRHNCAAIIRGFLRHIYDNGLSKKDYSIYIPKDNYKQQHTLPTTYEEEEIKNMINSVERSSAIGKRDYLILLLISTYGWRAKDITKFTFDKIDWDENVIRFNQHKTAEPNEFPLLASVGNAIIDYLKNGRPQSTSKCIIVSHNKNKCGSSLTSPTIHSIVTKYLKAAGIEGWSKKKHGPHAIRHSLAKNLLTKNVALPIIKTVLGHKSTESTKTYITVDYDKLKSCPLPMPPLHSPLYRKEDFND